MNAQSIERFELKSESSLKKCKLNHKSGKKERSTEKYQKVVAEKQRRKAKKTKTEKRDTFRRSEQPDERDDELENVHYANFLGDKRGSVLYHTPCNLTPLEEEPQIEGEKNGEDEEDEDEDEEARLYPDAGDYSIPRDEREYYMEWEFYPETKTLSGKWRFRRMDEEKEGDLPTTLTLEMPEDDNY